MLVFVIRRLCTSTAPVRVRFAPSPTGYLHLGGLRTAIYNWLFTRSQKGSFILRIEDTDQKRLVPGAVEALERDLDWIGVTRDEGPSCGGGFGPYTQSERLSLYRDSIQQLHEKDKVYRCFCTPDRLELLRREQAKNGENRGYDNRCRAFTSLEVDEKLAKKMPFVWRFKMESDLISHTDVVYGEHINSQVALSGDQVLLKSDGWPTYHFANIVDDHNMQISHVLRGQEWLSSTALHVQLYRAFGWDPPFFAHLPNLLNTEGKKLSKRQGDLNIQHLRDQRYSPLAVMNFVMSYGGGIRSWNYQDGLFDRLWTLDELIEKFDLSTINTQTHKVSIERLDTINEVALRATPMQSLVSEVKEMLTAKYGSGLENLPHAWDVGNPAYIERILQYILIYRLSVVSQFMSGDFQYLWMWPDYNELRQKNYFSEDTSVSLLEGLCKELSQFTEDEFKITTISPRLRTFVEGLSLDYPVVMRFVRHVLTGSDQGQPVAELLEMFGKQLSLDRIEMAISALKQH